MSVFSKSLIVISTLLLGPLSADFRFPSYAGDVGIGYEYFRGIPEGDWEGNTGALIDFNVGAPSPYFSEYVTGIQFGGSYGVYDWAGRGSASTDEQTSPQQQLFLTGAVFKKTEYCSGINLGLAFDWMWNKNIGVLAVDNEFSQLRVRGGYLYEQNDEWGIWGTLDTHTSHRTADGIPVAFRALSQVNLYWEHYFANCSRTMVWIGLPYKKSLAYSTGRAGTFIIGADFHSPLTNRLSIEGHASYMGPHSAPGAFKQRNYGANICIELKWAFGDTDKHYTPYMSSGNNSNFLTDTSITF